MKLLSTPLELQSLLSQGIVAKTGAYYRVRNIRDLPDSARALIYEVVQDSRGTKLKFRKLRQATMAKFKKATQ